MKKTEKIVGVLALLGIVMKFLLIPGSGVLTVLSLSTLSMIYFALSFVLFNDISLENIFKRESYRGISPARMIGTIGLGISLSELTIGILFRIQSYPGSRAQLMTGLFFTIIILIVALIQFRKNKSNFYKKIFARIIIVGGIALLAFLTPHDYLMKVLHRNHPEYIEQMNSEQFDNR